MIGVILATDSKNTLKPITEIIPKPFIPIKGKTLVEFAIEKLKKSYKIDKIILITKKEYEDWIYPLERKHYILEVYFENENKIINNFLEKEDLIVFPIDNFIDFDITDFINYAENKNRFYVLAVNTKNKEIAKNYKIVKVGKDDLVTYYGQYKEGLESINVLTDIFYIPKGFYYDNYLFERLSKERKLYSYIKKGTFIKINKLEDLKEALKIVKVNKENRLLEAYKYSKDNYYIKLRRNRIPYLEHPIALIGFLRIFTEDEDVLIEGLLHDVVEEGKAKYEEIKEKFGERIAKISEVLNEGYEETKKEEKLIRFFDTLHNFLMAFSDGSYKVNKYVEKRLERSLIMDLKEEIEYFKKYVDKRKPIKEIYIDPKIYDEVKDELGIYEDDYIIKIEYPKNKDDVFIGKDPITENSYYYDKRFRNCTLYFLLEKVI